VYDHTSQAGGIKSPCNGCILADLAASEASWKGITVPSRDARLLRSSHIS